VRVPFLLTLSILKGAGQTIRSPLKRFYPTWFILPIDLLLGDSETLPYPVVDLLEGFGVVASLKVLEPAVDHLVDPRNGLIQVGCTISVDNFPDFALQPGCVLRSRGPKVTLEPIAQEVKPILVGV
jgi:hypothetical protein